MKALKVVHIVCAIVWFGSAVSMNLLRHLVGNLDAAGMYWMAEILEAIDMKILVPGAVGCLLTGIVYGLFTTWGFFKHRWLTVKWVLTLFMILFGTFYMGPLVKENVVNRQGDNGGQRQCGAVLAECCRQRLGRIVAACIADVRNRDICI